MSRCHTRCHTLITLFDKNDLVELLISQNSSRGNPLLIRVYIYQNVCFYVYIPKMVPAIFSFHFQGQRSKLTALKLMVPMIASLFMVDFLRLCVPTKPDKIESKYITV